MFNEFENQIEILKTLPPSIVSINVRIEFNAHTNPVAYSNRTVNGELNRLKKVCVCNDSLERERAREHHYPESPPSFSWGGGCCELFDEIKT
jgi:hypothetical protein